MSLRTSGTTPVVTTSDEPVTLISLGDGLKPHRVRIVNGGNNAGFFSVDGGTTWIYLAASGATYMKNLSITHDIVAKRIPGGSNLADVYGSAW